MRHWLASSRQGRLRDMLAGLRDALSVRPLSRASSLPQDLRTAYACDHSNLWEPSLLAKRPSQAIENQPASNHTPVAAEAAPASRTSGAAACGNTRTTA